jgi:hypothetical protein
MIGCTGVPNAGDEEGIGLALWFIRDMGLILFVLCVRTAVLLLKSSIQKVCCPRLNRVH